MTRHHSDMSRKKLAEFESNSKWAKLEPRNQLFLDRASRETLHHSTWLKAVKVTGFEQAARSFLTKIFLHGFHFPVFDIPENIRVEMISELKEQGSKLSEVALNNLLPNKDRQAIMVGTTKGGPRQRKLLAFILETPDLVLYVAEAKKHGLLPRDIARFLNKLTAQYNFEVVKSSRSKAPLKLLAKPAKKKIIRRPTSMFDLREAERKLVEERIRGDVRAGRKSESQIEPIIWAAFFRINTYLESSSALKPKVREEIINKYLDSIVPER